MTDVIRPTLTQREIQVALGVADGKTCDEIAKDLRLGFETVRSHMAGLRDKTELRRKVQLAMWAMTHRDWLKAQYRTARAPLPKKGKKK